MRVGEIDGIRGLLSLSIALVHVTLAIGWVPQHEFPAALRASWTFSLELFFVLGGFVAALPVAAYGRIPGRVNYALRRAGRLLPLYYLTLAAAVVAGSWLRPVSGGADFPHDAEAVLAHVFFLQRPLLPNQEGFGVHGVVWTMSVVAAFYLVFALFGTRYLRRPYVGVAIAALVVLIWRLTTEHDVALFLQAPLFALDFAIGMTAAAVLVRTTRGQARAPNGATAGLAVAGGVALLAGLLYIAGLPIHRGEANYYAGSLLAEFLAPVVMGVLLVAIPYAPRWLRGPLASGPLRWIGSLSYGLFLFHFLVMWAVLATVDIPRDGTRANVLALAALVIPISLALSWAATRLIEDPIRERAQRLGARYKPAG